MARDELVGSLLWREHDHLWLLLWDKKAAQNAGWRTPEATLQLLSLVGDWPGALIAQALLRHKTRKPSFLVGYWITVIVNCIALGEIVVKGVAPVKLLLGDAI